MKSLAGCILFLSFLFISCADKITNVFNDETPELSSPPDLNVIHTSYSLITIHNDHMNSSFSPGYNYLVNIDIKLDKPENRNQINKLIIVNSQGFGWEFFNDELEAKYSDTLKGYSLENLLYNFTGTSSTPNLSQSFKIKIYSLNNTPANDYDFILKNDFMSPFELRNNWISQNKLRINIYNYYYYGDFDFATAEIIWLNSSKQFISKNDFEKSSVTEGIIYFDDIPSDAIYFYINTYNEKNNIKYESKSMLYNVAERLPANIQALEINSFNNLIQLSSIQKILFINRDQGKLYLVDINSMAIEFQYDLQQNANSICYSESEQKIYVGYQNGRIYSTIINENNFIMVKNLFAPVYGLKIINNFLIGGIGSSEIKVINLENDSVKSFYSGVSISSLIYNEKYGVLYGLSYYDIVRYNLNLQTGELTNFKSVSNYYNSSVALSSDKNRLLTSRSLYNCSSDYSNDLTEVASLNNEYDIVQFSEDNSTIIALETNTNYSNFGINIFSASGMNLINNISSFYANPQTFFINGDDIKVISYENSGIYWVESFKYSEILSKKNFITFRKFYLMKRIQ